MFASQSSFLDHVKLLRRAAQAAGAELIFAGDTLAALLRRGERRLVLYPQFLLVQEGAVRRTPALHDQSQAFLGYLPYPSRHWPLAVDRLAFKRHCAAAGLPVPQLPAGNGDPTGVVVRRAQPSFEPFVRGPFRRASEQPLDAAQGEFYEPYVEGDALIAWFWEGQPVCAALVASPEVTGDGKTALGELVVRGAQRGGMVSALELQLRLAEAQQLARLRGLELSAVPQAGAKLVIGLGHGSPLLGAREHRFLDMGSGPEAPWAPDLRRAGKVLWEAIPEELRAGTLFAVNATVDGQGRAWLLDMDASPYVHPLTYLPMLRTLLGVDSQPPAELHP